MVQSQDPPLTIAGLAAAGGVGVETVRYYQRRGLLVTPDRAQQAGKSAGFRRYDAEAVRRLNFIRAAQAAGFTLEQIRELITLDATDDRPRVRTIAAERLNALDDKICRLQAARAALAHLAATCETGGRGPCPILTAFEAPAATVLPVLNVGTRN